MHPFSIVYYILEGGAFYEIDGVRGEFKEGKLYILPANRRFSVYADENVQMNHLYFHTYTYPEIERLIVLDPDEDEFLLAILTELRRFTTNEQSWALTLPSQKLLELLISYVSEIESNANLPLPARIKQYIEKNYIHLFKRNDLDTVFGYSISRINHFFKSAYGMTTVKYRDILITKHIVTLLKEGRPSKLIAEELGFSSPAAFCRFVKTKYGVIPSKVKRRQS